MASNAVNISENTIEHMEAVFNQNQNYITNNYYETLNKKKPKNFKYGLPPPTQITGRDQEIEELTDLLKTEKRIVISGMGGIGKTSLSAHCARKWSKGGFLSRWFRKIDHVIFLNTETDITVENSIKNLCENPKINFKNYDSQRRAHFIQLVYQKFNKDKLLIIFDNVISFSDVQKYMPPQEQNNVITIFTSQNTEFDANFHIYKLNVLNKTSCMDLIKNQFEEQWEKIENQEKEIEELMEKLQFLPLPICQSVAYVKDQLKFGDKNYALKNYLDNFETNFKDSFPEYKNEIYKKPAFTAIEMNISLLKRDKKYGEKAELVLHCMGYLDPSSISEDLLLLLFDLKGNDMIEIKRLLMKYSLVNSENTDYINIHRLIQQTCRIITKENKEFVKYFKNMLKKVIGSNIYRSHLKFIKPYIENFGLQLLNECYIELYNSSPRRDELTKTLERVNYDYNAVEGWTVAHFAAFEHNKEMLNLLKSIEHTFNKTSPNKWTILHSAALNEYNMTEVLELEPQNLNLQNNDMNTAMHLLMSGRCTGQRKCKYCNNSLDLIKAGCDINLINNERKTVVYLAIVNHHIKALAHILYFCTIDIFSPVNQINVLAKQNYITLFKLTSRCGTKIWYEQSYLTPSSLKESKKLLKGLHCQNLPEEVQKDIAILFDCIPLALQLATAYIQHTNISGTNFIRDLLESTVPEFIKNNCFGYMCNEVSILLYKILDKLQKENELSFRILTYISCTDKAGLSIPVLQELLNENVENICESINVLTDWFLLEKSERNIVPDLIRSFTQIYIQDKSIIEDISLKTLTHGYGSSLAVRYLGQTGVKNLYENKYNTESAHKHVWLKKLCELDLVTDEDINQFSVLHWAVVYYNRCVIYELFAQDVIVNAVTNRTVTPLHIAAANDFPILMILLLEAGSDVNLCDIAGNTPAHWAALTGCLSNVEYLKEHCADLNIKNKKSQTPLSILTSKKLCLPQNLFPALKSTC